MAFVGTHLRSLGMSSAGLALKAGLHGAECSSKNLNERPKESVIK